MKGSILAFTAGLLMIFTSSTNALAVQPNEKEKKQSNIAAPQPLVNSNVKENTKIDKPRLLFTESTPIKREIEIIDSLLFEQELDEEGFEFPADELYGEWNTRNVNPYGHLTMPDTFNIDLSAVIMPVDDEVIRITSPFGPRRRRMHKGIDLKVQVGDTIRAVCDGKIRVKRFEKRGYGYFLVLRHTNGMETVYGHLSKFLVEEDQIVRAGQAIALGGNTGRSTGSHLHFETRFFGVALNPAHLFDFGNKVMHKDEYVFTKSKANEVISKYTGKGTSKIAYHRVKSGETLGSIARKHGMSVSQLCKLNKITAKTVIRAGKTLRLS